MIIDFRRASSHDLSVIHGEDVEMVESYKYLGTVIDSKLRFDLNTDAIVKRGNQRVYLLRKLNSFNVNKNILNNFYCSFIESLFTFSFICWFKSLSLVDKNRLQKIVKICSKIIGIKLRDLSSLYEEQVLRKAKCILSQPLHPLFPEFDLLPSGRRFRVPQQDKRFSKTFVPSAIKELNSKGIH